MTWYPDRHHPCFFLEDALRALGADAQVIRNDETLNCWGLKVDGKLMVYLIDNRWQHEREHEDPAALELIKRGVLVTCAQKPDAERVGAKWLPLAVTPGYRFEPRAKIFDVGFVGYVRDQNRAEMLQLVAARYTTAFSQGCFGDSAVSDYWQSRVGLNVVTNYSMPNAYDTWNMRSPEIMATATPLVLGHEDYLSELGVISGENCMTYDSPAGMLAAIQYLINTPELAVQIGIAGMNLVLARHTYTHRARQVIEWLV
jgi:hypothetical protein